MARIPSKREVSAMAGPPDKRRRKNIEDCSSLWDNDDADDFTNDQLENIDHMIACSQMTTADVAPDTHGRSRVIGRGTGRSQSLTEGQTSRQRQDNFLPGAHSSRQYLSSERLNHCRDTSRHVSDGKLLPSSPSVAASTGNEQNSQGLPNSNSTADINGSKLKRTINNCQCEVYKEELRKLKDGQYSKDGQIKMLRASLAQRDAEMRREKMERLKVIEEESKAQSAKEQNLTQELKSLKTQLQFKEQEIAEVQALYKRLESKQGIANNHSSDRSPQPTRSNTPKSPRMQKNAFSSRHSCKSAPEISNGTTSSDRVTKTIKRSFRMALKCQKVMSGVRMVDKLLDTDRSSGLVNLLQSVSLEHSSGQFTSTTAKERGSVLAEAITRDTKGKSHRDSSNNALAMSALSTLLHQQKAGLDELFLLPLIEEHVDAYIEHAERLAANHKTEESSLLSADYERLALSALKLLCTLTEHSQNVCRALVHGVSAIDGAAAANEVTDAKEPGRVWLAQVQCGSRMVAKCQLFNKLIKLSNPLLCQDNAGSYQITTTALLILVRLVQTTNLASLDRFEALVCEDNLVTCLNDHLDISRDGQFMLASRTLDILGYLLRSRHLLAQCCARSDDCLLQLACGVCLQEDRSWTSQQLVHLGLQVVTLLLTVVSHHKQGAVLILNNSCSCSTEIVKSVVLLLHCVIHKCYISNIRTHSEQTCSMQRGCCNSWIQEDCTEGDRCTSSRHEEQTVANKSLLLLRKGFCLLHCLAAHDPPYSNHCHQVEHQYVEIVCTAERIFQQADTGVSEHELVSLRELWDWDHEYGDLSNEEEDEPANINSAS